jgi:hypothetical protein
MPQPSTRTINSCERVITYFDRVWITFFNPGGYDKINRSLHSARRTGLINDFDITEAFNYKTKIHDGYKVDIKQPKREFFGGSGLHKNPSFSPLVRYTIVKVEIAYDFVVSNEKAAVELRDVLGRCIVKKRIRGKGDLEETSRGRQPKIIGEEEAYKTIYFARIKSSSNIVIYVPKKKKVGSIPYYSCHLEFRLKNGDTVFNQGLITLDDLFRFDEKKWLMKTLNLYEVQKRGHWKIGLMYKSILSDKATDKYLYKNVTRESTKRSGLNVFNNIVLGERFLAQRLWYFEGEGKKMRQFLVKSSIGLDALNYEAY